MGKKRYTSPATIVVTVVQEGLMETASPGVQGPYNPHKPIEAKGNNVFPEEGSELPHYSPWED